jgi:hypothetical protein
MEAILAYLGEELAVALLAAEQTDEQHSGAVDGEQGANAVELGGKDLEDDQGKGELRQGGAHVGAFEGSLGGADLDHLVRGQDGRAGAVHPQAVAVGCVPLEHIVSEHYFSDGERLERPTSNMMVVDDDGGDSIRCWS